MYAKVIKYLMWVLLLVSVAVSIYGFAVGFESNDAQPVDVVLYWAYALVGIAVVSAVIVSVVINALNNPKSLISLGVILLAAAVVIGGAYLLAPGSPAVGLVSAELPSAGTLKLTDTILNLTYLACGAAVLSVVVGEIVALFRK